MADFIDEFVEMQRRVFELERRAANRKRTGTVQEVDLKKGVARVLIESDGERPFLSPAMPWKEIAAGGISTHIPPTIGQQVDVVSESGDLTDGIIDFSTHSNANPRPHDGPEAVVVHGATRFVISDGKVDITADVTVNGNLQVNGKSMRHNEKNVGDSHTHGGIEPGGANTDEPNP